MSTLQPFQTSLRGRHLIEASAGTGKTFNIATLFVRGLVELALPINNILVVTYTEAATKELKDRLLTRITDCITVLKSREHDDNDYLKSFLEYIDEPEKAINRLENALHSFDEASIYTIHGFCYHALQEQAFQSKASFDTEMLGNDADIVQEVVDDYWRQWIRKAGSDENRKTLLKFISSEGYTPDRLADELASIVDKSYMEILPEGEFRPEPHIEELRHEFKQMNTIWNSCRDEIQRLLESDELSGNKYNKKYIPDWMNQMDDFLLQDVPPINLFDKFHKFTLSELQKSLKKSALQNGKTVPEHPFFTMAESYRATAGAISVYPAYFKKKLLNYLQNQLKKRKQRRQILSYDDLLNHLKESLSDSKTGEKLSTVLRNKYPLALVDEFQDTDPIQYEIFDKLYPPDSNSQTGLFMIGDPKQSIYSFRGADVHAYLRAGNSISDKNRHSLQYNFRSTPEFIQGVNGLFGEHDNPFLLKNITFQPVKPGKPDDNYRHFRKRNEVQPPIEFRSLKHRSDELPVKKKTANEWVAEDTAEEIFRLLNNAEFRIGDREVEGRDIAVLVRKHSQAEVIGDALLEKGIKSVRYSRESVFKSTEAEELSHLLKAVAEPTGERALAAALSTRILGFNAGDLLKLKEDEKQWVNILDQFRTWFMEWHKYGFAYMFRSIMQEMDVAGRVVQYRNGERILTNLLHLSELLQQQEVGKDNPRALIHWFAKKRKNPDKEAEEEQLRLESDEDLVKVVTMHRSKGLQYPIVFCPFLWHGPEHRDRGKPLIYYESDNSEKVIADLSGKENENRDLRRIKVAREKLAETMRLAYVAITRAEYRCVILWVPASKSEFSALGYLLLPSGRVENILENTIRSDKKYTSVEPGLYSGRLKEITDKYPGIISAVEVRNDDIADGKANNSDDDLKLSFRAFQRHAPLQKGPAISSFSRLVYSDTGHSDFDLVPYYDGFREAEVKTGDPEEQSISIFTFPRGPQPGTCIHQIYENIDFQKDDHLEETVLRQLLRYGIDDRWKEVVTRHIQTTLEKPLSGNIPNLSLSSIPEEDRIPELEFYFKSDAVELSRLLEIIGHAGTAGSRFADPGYLKGFIDLTFRFNGKYYLLDYKTNHLGNTPQDYDLHNMKEEIDHHMYDLQYYLYSIALHRFLKNNISNYSYGKHFGGAFYLFIRGVNEEGNEGIYFNKPEEQRMEQLDAYLLGRELS